MSDFRWIALALTVTAGCQVYDRVPWRRLRSWLWAKALALRSWVFDEGYREPVRDVLLDDELGDVLAREAGRELQFDANETAEEWARRHAPTPHHRDGCADSEVGTCSCPRPIAGPPPPDPDATEVEALPLVRRRPTRSEAAKARKKAKR